MTSYPDSFSELIKLPDARQLELIYNMYVGLNMSYPDIAEKLNTYPNKIRRLAAKLGIKTRDRSEAQKLVLSSGKNIHPTKGKKHSEESRIKISDAMANIWDTMSDEDRAARAKLSKEQWDSLSPEEQEEFRRLASNAVREAAKNGSKLEHYFMNELISLGYKVEFHKEHMVKNDRLQVDLFLPKINTIIEVDGPSHFAPIWGEDVLSRNRKSDAQKDGLFLAMGFCVIRIQQGKGLSNKYKRTLLARLVGTLESIKKSFPGPANRHIVLD